VYFKECSVVKPCQLQEGVLWDQYKLKYDILLRALLASGRHPSQVEEINYREDARKAWEDSLPPYVPNVNSFNVSVPVHRKYQHAILLLPLCAREHHRLKHHAVKTTADTFIQPTTQKSILLNHMLPFMRIHVTAYAHASLSP
jgi:hypothetical protein